MRCRLNLLLRRLPRWTKYAEVHVLDLRFFKGDVAEYAKENGITDALVLYGVQNFVKDTNLRF